jgi:hypothetical protein
MVSLFWWEHNEMYCFLCYRVKYTLRDTYYPTLIFFCINTLFVDGLCSNLGHTKLNISYLLLRIIFTIYW